MASDGDTITYSYTGSKETEDISAINEITIDQMNGADGQDSNDYNGGSGGYISNATADVSEYSTLDIWVGETPSDQTGGFGRANGGAAGGSGDAGGGGGSTELWTNSNLIFIAAADAGGGGDHGSFPPLGDYGPGGGARGGLGITNGDDGEGSGFGGDGGDGGDGLNGGQELGIASGGTTTTGGSTDGNGEITLSFKVLPKFDQPLALDEKRNGRIPSVSYSETADKLRIYRGTGDNPSFPSDFTQIDEVSGTSISDYTDTGSPYDSDVHYAVVPVEGGSEKSVQGFADQYIPPQDAAEIGRV